MTLGKFADATLYLVRHQYTYKKQIGLLDELYRQNKLPKVTIILNDVKVRTGYGYYGYGRYGYGKSYGYGEGYFTEDEPKQTFIKRWFGGMVSNGNGKQKKRRQKQTLDS